MCDTSRLGASATTLESLAEVLLGVAEVERLGVLDAELLDDAASSVLLPAQAARGAAVSTTAIAARSHLQGSVTPLILSARQPPKPSVPGSEQTRSSANHQ